MPNNIYIILPPPDLPNITMNSPRFIVTDTPRNAGTPSNPNKYVNCCCLFICIYINTLLLLFIYMYIKRKHTYKYLSLPISSTPACDGRWLG